MAVRFAKEKDLPRVNELRKQVNDLHAAGKPEFFRPGFSKELADLVFAIFDDPDKKIVVAEREGVVCGFAVLHRVIRPENPYMFERVCLDVDEFCVDAPYRRKGVGSELIAFIRAYAKENGFRRIELNMQEFNRDALAFYESAGFSTYRRYLELEP